MNIYFEMNGISLKAEISFPERDGYEFNVLMKFKGKWTEFNYSRHEAKIEELIHEEIQSYVAGGELSHRVLRNSPYM